MYSATYNGPSRIYRTVVGTLLTALSLIIFYEILTRLRALFDTPDSFKSFLTLVPQDASLRTIIVNNQPVILPEGLFYHLSFSLSIALLLVAALIAGSLLRRGISLL